MKLIKYAISVILSIIIYGSKTMAQPNSISSTYRIMYELDYTSDSTHPDRHKKENMVLFSNAEGSVFMSFNKFKTDSLLFAYSKINKMASSAELILYQTPIRYYIYKRYNSDTIQTIDNIAMQAFTYAQPKNISWQIYSDSSMNINGITCQKAECNFGGRHWTVWFAPSIPISDGPYKFSGLPGLILRANDNNNYYKFSIMSFITQHEEIPKDQSILSKVEATSKQKFLEKHHQYAQDPMPFMMNNNSSGGGKIIFKDKEGAIRMGKAMQKVDTPIEW